MSTAISVLDKILALLTGIFNYVKKNNDTNRRDDIADDSSKLLVDKLGGKSDVKEFNSTDTNTKEQSSSDN